MDLDDDLDLSADDPRQDQVVDTNVVPPVDTVEAMEAELASIDALRHQAILALRLASARKEQEQGFLLVNPEVTTANRPVNPSGAMVMRRGLDTFAMSTSERRNCSSMSPRY